MKLLEEILENSDDGEEYIISFYCGDQLGLMDFEMVDESIYERTDMCIADVVSQKICDKKYYTVGTKIEFSLKDIVSVVSPKNGKKIWANG